MSDPIVKFEELRSSADILFIVFYRGHWCPFCNGYLKDLQSVLGSIKNAQGVAMAITAENAEFLPTMRTQTGFEGEMISDPEHKIATELNEKYGLSVAISEKKGYPHGMAQPAVLVLRKDGTELFKWAIVPSLMNIGGAKDRPSITEIWEDVQSKMAGKQVNRVSYSTQSFFKIMGAKLFGR